MQIPTRTDQDQFEELQIVDFAFAEALSASDMSDVITKRTEMREIDIEELLHMLTALMRPMRRTRVTVFPFNSGSIAQESAALARTEMPPPSRFTRRSRAARPSPAAN